MEEEQPLVGGVANVGQVVRVGQHVLRPASPHVGAIHAFLRGLRDAGFEAAPVPLGIDDDGRERLVFIEGDVPVPPYPTWAQTDTALSSIAGLMARFHDAARAFDSPGLVWSTDMADPEGGVIVCHNDVRLENVVFNDGVAVGMLDFDYCAPGRPVHDLAQFARMCVPLEDEVHADRLGWLVADRPARLRLVADTYGLTVQERSEFIAALDGIIARGGEFVHRRAVAGDPTFVALWNEIGGTDRFDRRRRWWAQGRQPFVDALR